MMIVIMTDVFIPAGAKTVAHGNPDVVDDFDAAAA